MIPTGHRIRYPYEALLIELDTFRACAYPKLLVLNPAARSTVCPSPRLDMGPSVDVAAPCVSRPSTGFGREEEAPDPRPPIAHPTSMPLLMDQSHVKAKTGVLIRTLRTGKMSGKRAGGETSNSRMCSAKHAA